MDGRSSQFSIETILPSTNFDKEKSTMKTGGDVPPSLPQGQAESSPYRPCLMVADTSDQGADSSANKKIRRPRTCFSDEQLKELEGRFRINKYVSVADRTLLCSELGLTDSQIKTWFQNRRTKWKRLNEARYNLLGGGVDDRLLRKDIPYYNTHPGLTIPSFQNKLGEQQSSVSSTVSGIGSLGHNPHNVYSFSNNFHSFPNYMWGSYSSHGYNSQSTSLGLPSVSSVPLTTHSSSYSALNSLNASSVTPLTGLNSGLTPMTTPLSPVISPTVTSASNQSNTGDEETSSTTAEQQHFHSLYPTNKDHMAYSSTKEPCVSYSPYYSPYHVTPDKSLRSQYHSTAALT